MAWIGPTFLCGESIEEAVRSFSTQSVEKRRISAMLNRSSLCNIATFSILHIVSARRRMSFSGSRSGRYRTTCKAALLLIAVLAAGCAQSRENAETAYKLEPAPAAPSHETININTAGIDELRRIPNIGEGLAMEIIRHRNEHGPFRRPESLMLVRGIGDKRFREIRHLIRID